jgi:hypothetical protein
MKKCYIVILNKFYYKLFCYPRNAAPPLDKLPEPDQIKIRGSPLAKPDQTALADAAPENPAAVQEPR